jgi:hypothetical protein
MSGTLWTFNSLNVTLYSLDSVLNRGIFLVQLNITHVSLPKGGTGKRCDYMDTERFMKDKRCIIQIQNKDGMCCARAIVTAKPKIDGHEQWNSIQRGRRTQEELALELHAKAGVPLHQCGIEDVKTFQRFLDMPSLFCICMMQRLSFMNLSVSM